jgi:hypothetical protein
MTTTKLHAAVDGIGVQEDTHSITLTFKEPVKELKMTCDEADTIVLLLAAGMLALKKAEAMQQLQPATGAVN